MGDERTFLVEKRKSRRMSIPQAARHLRISEQLLTMLEEDDKTITHPNIAARIDKLYELTVEQYETMVNLSHRDGTVPEPVPMRAFRSYDDWYRNHKDEEEGEEFEGDKPDDETVADEESGDD